MPHLDREALIFCLCHRLNNLLQISYDGLQIIRRGIYAHTAGLDPDEIQSVGDKPLHLCTVLQNTFKICSDELIFFALQSHSRVSDHAVHGDAEFLGHICKKDRTARAGFPLLIQHVLKQTAVALPLLTHQKYFRPIIINFFITHDDFRRNLPSSGYDSIFNTAPLSVIYGKCQIKIVLVCQLFFQIIDTADVFSPLGEFQVDTRLTILAVELRIPAGPFHAECAVFLCLVHDFHIVIFQIHRIYQQISG